MIGETREYTLTLADGQTYTIPDAQEIVPGLLAYRIPNDLHPSNPNRWRIGHEQSGRSVADAMTREQLIKGAELLATLADWTQSIDQIRPTLDRNVLYTKLSRVGCIQPRSWSQVGDFSRNGTYTDADIEEMAAEAKASGFNAADILVDMSQTVPWMGLDTNDFNEAHDRICRAAGIDA